MNLRKTTKRYESVRNVSLLLAAPLSAEDCSIQSMTNASPTRWHLAHTAWFFETFLLKQMPGYVSPWPQFEQLFNSYYNSVSELFDRSRRGCFSRPNLDEVQRYRQHVDRCVIDRLNKDQISEDHLDVLEIGIHHEQQHQELMLTDIKHGFACSPLFPVYRQSDFEPVNAASELVWVDGPNGLAEIGHSAEGFAFDNELPKHSFHLSPYCLASRIVTNAEFLQFIQDDGYTRPELWLSLGWDAVQSHGWSAPLYWQERDDDWETFTLAGLRPLNGNEPVCHISYFEADAYARWAGHRLPTEHEWEAMVMFSSADPDSGLWADQLVAADRAIHPKTANPGNDFDGAFGNIWEWTSSQYNAYPRYAPADGALGEYNGKFMCNQFVLRGGSCATPSGHIRTTYRNFFPPETRWQFSGIRLAMS